MTRPPIRHAIACLLAALACAGCGEDRGLILNPNVPRNPVVFESPAGASTFEDALRERYDDGAADLPTGTLSLNAFFNREVELADSDGDGIISDVETAEYAAR